MARAVADMDRNGGAFLHTDSPQALKAVIQNKKQLFMEVCQFRALGCAASLVSVALADRMKIEVRGGQSDPQEPAAADCMKSEVRERQSHP